MTSATQRLLAVQPFCTYCGGETPSTSRDHAPPLTIFDGRDRPKGLEFGACQACHDGTRQMDQIIGPLSRLYGESDQPNHQAELRQQIHEFINRHPFLATELIESAPVIRGGKLVGHVINIRDGYLTDVCSPFAARMGFALYREIAGAPIPTGGGVAVRWYSNVDAFEGKLPEDLLGLMGPRQTLSAGRKNVGNQFAYRWAATDDKQTLAIFAGLRMSFAFTAFAKADRSDFPPVMQNRFNPGFLRTWRAPTGRGRHLRTLQEAAERAGFQIARQR